jgi:hypothetical protein
MLSLNSEELKSKTAVHVLIGRVKTKGVNQMSLTNLKAS